MLNVLNLDIPFDKNDFHMLQGEGRAEQVRILWKMNFFPIHDDYDEYALVWCKHKSGKELLLVWGVGVVYFGDSPLFDELYPIWNGNWIISWYWIRRWDIYEMYTFDDDFIAHPIVFRIDNALNITWDFSSYDNLVSFIRFYYSWVFNNLEI